MKIGFIDNPGYKKGLFNIKVEEAKNGKEAGRNIKEVKKKFNPNPK